MGLGYGGGNSKPTAAESKSKAKAKPTSKDASAVQKNSGKDKKPAAAAAKGNAAEKPKKGAAKTDLPKEEKKGAGKGKSGEKMDQAGGHTDAFEVHDDGTITKTVNAGEWEFYKNLKKFKKLQPFCPRFVSVSGKADADPKVRMGDLTHGYVKPCIMDIKMGVTSAAPDADDAKRKAMSKKDEGSTTVSMGIRVVGMKTYNASSKKATVRTKPWGKSLTADTISDGIAEFFDQGRENWREELVKPFVDLVLALQKYFRAQTDLMFISSSLLFVYDADPKSDPKCQLKMIDFAHVFPLAKGEYDEGYLTGLKHLLAILEGMAAGNIGGKDEASDDDEDAKAAAGGLAAVQLTDAKIDEEWERADKDGSGTLDFKEIVRLLGKLNVKKPDKVIKEHFNAVDVDNSKELDKGEFKLFLKRVRQRQEIQDIFDTANGATGKQDMTPKVFAKWIKETQKEDVSEKEAKKLIAEFEDGGNLLHIDGFAAYLQSGHCSGLSAEHRAVTQDMSQPMAHYWLASSHNTYLLGDQLKGESSIEAYKATFKKSCRCVELDCWDNPKDKSMPIIYHGHTLTSKITFEDVIKCIRDYGFAQSEYPIILSLEVHCNEEGQRAMAKILLDILGEADMLPEQFEKQKRCPSPGELKKKVLLKGKMGVWDDADDEDEDDRAATLAAIKAAEAEDAKAAKKGGKKGVKDDKADGEDAAAAVSKKKKKATVAKELSDLVHLKAVHFKDWEDSKANGQPWEMSSFAEGKTLKILEKEPVAFADYNTRQLSRIYPKGLRIDSSNYDPIEMWCCGSQIVALNYQTGADQMWLNDGKFLGNGRAGYVLKPEFLRTKDVTFNYQDKGPVQKTLRIEVISGWQFPKGTSEKAEGEIIDPYISIAVHGVKADRVRHQTKTIKNNGFNPVWGRLSTLPEKKQPKPKQYIFDIPLTQPELAVLLFKVYDSDLVSANDFIAQFACSASHVGEGYRSLPLKNPDGKPYDGSSLLVKFSWV